MSDGGELLSQEEIDALLREVESMSSDSGSGPDGQGIADADQDVVSPGTRSPETSSPLTQTAGNVVDPVLYPELDSESGSAGRTPIELLQDVPLEVTVVLGQTRLRVRDVLSLSPGSIVELDRLAGEPVDVLVNGRMIAKGEVVVIDEHFGIRINEIVSRPSRSE